MLANLRRGLDEIWTSEDGPTAAEYALVLATFIVIWFVARGAVGTNVNSASCTVGSSIGQTVSGK